MKRQMTSSEPVEGVFVRRAAVSWTLCDCENLVPAEWGDERLAKRKLTVSGNTKQVIQDYTVFQRPDDR